MRSASGNNIDMPARKITTIPKFGASCKKQIHMKYKSIIVNNVSMVYFSDFPSREIIKTINNELKFECGIRFQFH